MSSPNPSLRIKKNLADLFSQIPIQVKVPYSLPPVAISGITMDSRQVQPGFLFVAIQGGSTDGHSYIPSALERGAVAVIGSRDLDQIQTAQSYLQVENPRLALAYLAAAFYGFPARNMTIIGVTGTDGKTTTCNLIYQILRAAGLRSGIISSVNAVIGDEVLDTGFHVTTPEAPEVQRYLGMMRDAGITHVVLEATSHGLAQHRVTACEFDIGVVTNITHEHLDFHGTYERYRDAKANLFRHLATTVGKPQGNPRLAVLNRDDRSYDYLAAVAGDPKVSYGLQPGADIQAEEVSYSPQGLSFKAVLPQGRRLRLESSLTGSYNVSNIMAALGATVVGLGIDPNVAGAGIRGLEIIPGRMEKINLGQDFGAIVDFAHTPNAILCTLQAARQMTSGRVIAVFGSAGLRDREKRRMMSEVSAKFADVTILTAEDPRTESLDYILQEMATAAESTGAVDGQTYFKIPDRGKAISTGVAMANPGDLVIALGKGHEQSMCFGEIEYPWDDRTAMRAAIAQRLGILGPEMPCLPTQTE